MNKVKCLIYCTKNGENLLHFGCGTGEYRCITNKNKKDVFENEGFNPNDITHILNGKIVAQFDCEKVERFDVPYPAYFWEVKDKLEHITNKSCLSLMSLHHYLKNDSGYAIHISNLEIFDKPKELYEYDIKPKPFKTFDGWSITNITYSCTKAPQNMCNVYDIQGNHYILISIRPEWVCKILNGEKTIEVRKQVLNCLKELI